MPSGCEFKFGSGKIDRIDTCEDENAVYVKVTDYKTGRKAFDITAFYHGLQMQLPVYLNAALEIERQKRSVRHQKLYQRRTLIQFLRTRKRKKKS